MRRLCRLRHGHLGLLRRGLRRRRLGHLLDHLLLLRLLNLLLLNHLLLLLLLDDLLLRLLREVKHARSGFRRFQATVPAGMRCLGRT